MALDDRREIIIGYDPEHAGADVIRLGRLLAEVLNHRPVVLIARPWPSFAVDPAQVQPQVDEEAEVHFAIVRERLAGFEPETLAAATPSVAGALDLLAVERNATMIVVGSAHRGPLGRTILGGVGESLMHGASRAVAVAPRGFAERDHPPLHRIAVAYDGSPEASVALATAIGLAQRAHGELTVIGVAGPPEYGYAAEWHGLAPIGLGDIDRKAKERLLEDAVSRAPTGLACEARLLTGHAGALLSEVSGEFDLLIAGSRAYGPVRRTILGSTTRKLIRSSACPVLVLPRGAGEDPLGVAG